MSKYDSDFVDSLRDDLKELTEKVIDIDKKIDLHTEKFDGHITHEDRYYNEILIRDERQIQELKDISRTLTINTQSLVEHMRRTSILEEAFGPVNVDFIGRVEFKKSLVFMGKILAGLVSLVSILAGLAMLLGKL